MANADRIIELLHEAKARRPGAEREQFLAAACGADVNLRAEVDELLGMREEEAGSFLKPAAAVSRGIEAEFARLRPEEAGERIGHYKLLEQIGQGGFGTVWVAEQEKPVRRRVALKIIKLGMDTKEVIARFEQERQALAMMDHPNIAKVFDAGATETGRPYFVMELVRGIKITEYCDQANLPTAQRLELFIAVCQAVQHAHQKGIIHRDLKPSNILVTLHDGVPVPKVIDFGVAKATQQQRLTDLTVYTQFEQMVGTPLYMSPEQAEMSGLDVDTRSDIYSLGVLLYELLTGRTPFDPETLMRQGLDEIRRAIREQEPQKPSTFVQTMPFEVRTTVARHRQAEAAKLAGLIRGDLDWIVMKAIEKDRTRRYETANGLLRDVERYLADEPVQACRPSAAYRLRKFVRRHKRTVVAAAAVLLALVGGVVGTTIGLVRAERARQAEARRAEGERLARQEAQEREAETEAVLGFVEQKVFQAARPEGLEGGLGHDVTLRRAMEAALPFVDQSFTDRPMIEARLRMTLGLSFLDQGDAKTAAAQFEAARALYRKHLGPDHHRTLASIGNLANSYAELGRYAEALKLDEETLPLRRSKLGPDHPDTLASMQSLANSYGELGRHAEALKLREETLALRRAKLGPDHPDTLANMANVATSYAAVGRAADALKLREETLALCRAKLGPHHPDTLLSMSNLAHSYAALGGHADALKLSQETLALCGAKLGPDHPYTLASMNNLANGYAALGRHAEALELSEETLALKKAKLGSDHPDTLSSMYNVAHSYAALDRHAEAIPVIDECVRRAEETGTRTSFIPGLITLRFRHFEKIKDPAGCRTSAEMWERLNRTEAGFLYDAACWRAATAAVLRSTGAAADAAGEADRAMDWLVKAFDAGYGDARHIEKDKDLDTLRDRLDFQELVAGLAARRSLAQQARGHARLGRFREAADDYNRAVARGSADHFDWYMLALLHAYLRDAEAYRDVCGRAVARFERSGNPVVHERVSRACLLLPLPGADASAAVRMGRKALALRGDSAWSQFAAGLAELRSEAGDPGRALELLSTARGGVKNGHAEIAIDLLRAMALHRAGRADEAKSALGAAVVYFDRHLGPSGSRPPGNNEDLWLVCHVLRREAEGLIGADQSTGAGVAPPAGTGL